MVFPVSSTNVVDAYNNLREATLNCQSYAFLVNKGAGSPPIGSPDVLNLLSSAVNLQMVAQQIIADTTLTSSLISYVQNVTGQASLDVQNDFNMSMAALGALIAAIQQDYPIDTNGFLLDRSFNAGNVSVIGFTAAQLPNALGAITAWLATIQ